MVEQGVGSVGGPPGTGTGTVGTVVEEEGLGPRFGGREVERTTSRGQGPTRVWSEGPTSA